MYMYGILYMVGSLQENVSYGWMMMDTHATAIAVLSSHTHDSTYAC